MTDIESLCKRFKFGDIEDIFVIIYSYFIIGYLVLFTTYEQNFINLQIYSQIILSVAISFPIMGITAILGLLYKSIDKSEESTNKMNKGRKEKPGFFYETTVISFLASVYYTSIFSLIYILKHSKTIEYNSYSFDPVTIVIDILKHSKIIEYNFDPLTTVKVISFTLSLLFLLIIIKTIRVSIIPQGNRNTTNKKSETIQTIEHPP